MIFMMRYIYISSNPNYSQNLVAAVERYTYMEYLSNDHKYISNQHQISHNLCNGKGYSILSLRESQ